MVEIEGVSFATGHPPPPGEVFSDFHQFSADRGWGTFKRNQTSARQACPTALRGPDSIENPCPQADRRGILQRTANRSKERAQFVWLPLGANPLNYQLLWRVRTQAPTK
jgi:hypothetical protein